MGKEILVGIKGDLVEITTCNQSSLSKSIISNNLDGNKAPLVSSCVRHGARNIFQDFVTVWPEGGERGDYPSPYHLVTQQLC
jgi:hypothetical protein